MKKRNYKEMMKEILQSYDKDPRGWQVLVGRSPRGPFDILFSSPNHAWLIKLDTIFKPKPIGFGVRLKKPSDIPHMEAPPYGFRPVNIRLLNYMIRSGFSPGKMNEVIWHTMKTPPVPFTEIKTPITAIGPYIHRPELELPSKKHRRLSMKLDEELMKLLRRKYPFYG